MIKSARRVRGVLGYVCWLASWLLLVLVLLDRQLQRFDVS